MGANEKHEATYHGGEYVPSMERVSIAWVRDSISFGGNRVQSEAQFDRWLETVRAEAKAEAYKDAARILHDEALWQLELLQRHNEYRFKHCSQRMSEMEACMATRANQYKEEPANGR